jgi:putative two-component system response regulator
VVAGLGAGADDYLAKPFRQPELLARIRSALRLRAALVRMETAHAVVATLANAVEAKDPTTEHHCQRLAFLSARLTARLELDHASAEMIAYGALLHDIGKIGIPERILHKPGPLDEEEWKVMKEHPIISEYILQEVDLHPIVLQVARSSHERIDGKGYPDQKSGDQIPLPARIVLVADAFDALTSDRPYRSARSVAAAMEELRAHAGTQFCPKVVEALEAVYREQPLLLGAAALRAVGDAA